MSQFTPGPWTWNERPHECSTYHELTGSDGEKVIESAEYEGCWLSNHKHTDANAALIARAPDLLRERDELREALVACAAALDPHLDRMLQQQGACGDTFRANARAEARAALSKVTP